MTDAPNHGGGPAFPHTRLVPSETGVSYPENVEGMTKQEYAAIHLLVPNSGTPWLDEMIREAMRSKFAGQVVARVFEPLLADEDLTTEDAAESASIWAYTVADAMVAEAAEG